MVQNAHYMLLNMPAMTGTGLDRIFGIQQIIHVQGSSRRAELNAIM